MSRKGERKKKEKRVPEIRGGKQLVSSNSYRPWVDIKLFVI